MSTRSRTAALRKAQRHLVQSDPTLASVVASIGPCTLWLNEDRFGSLARSIIAQQISSRAAVAIGARLQEALGGHGITAQSILSVPESTLRLAGLSGAKARALRDLAEKVSQGMVPLDELHALEDEAVIERLLPVWGIGRWTAEMFLIFSLGRQDVLPVADLGLRAAARRHYRLRKLPDRKRLTRLAEPWRPYRSIATWYLWRSLGGVPQSD